MRDPLRKKGFSCSQNHPDLESRLTFQGKGVLVLPPGGEGQRTFRCCDCDRSDPMKTDKAMRWIKSGLQPPT